MVVLLIIGMTWGKKGSQIEKVIEPTMQHTSGHSLLLILLMNIHKVHRDKFCYIVTRNYFE